MRIVEALDGTVAVVELDPAKKYWIIADQDCGIDWSTVRWGHGLILLKRPSAEIAFVENPDRVIGVAALDGQPE